MWQKQLGKVLLQFLVSEYKRLDTRLHFKIISFHTELKLQVNVSHDMNVLTFTLCTKFDLWRIIHRMNLIRFDWNLKNRIGSSSSLDDLLWSISFAYTAKAWLTWKTLVQRFGIDGPFSWLPFWLPAWLWSRCAHAKSCKFPGTKAPKCSIVRTWQIAEKWRYYIGVKNCKYRCSEFALICGWIFVQTHSDKNNAFWITECTVCQPNRF